MRIQFDGRGFRVAALLFLSCLAWFDEAAACGTLQAGQSLAAGAQLSSCNGQYTLAAQTDGNLVLYNSSGAIWNTGTQTGGIVNPTTLAMQSDGNLVFYGSSNSVIWSSQTGGTSGSYLAVQDDGNLVLYSATPGQYVWTKATPICGTLYPGQQIPVGSSLSSCNGSAGQFAVQSDGNIVFYVSGIAKWATHTNGQPVSFVQVNPNGAVEAITTSGSVAWTTYTAGNNLASFLVTASNAAIVSGSSNPWTALGMPPCTRGGNAFSDDVVYDADLKTCVAYTGSPNGTANYARVTIVKLGNHLVDTISQYTTTNGIQNNPYFQKYSVDQWRQVYGQAFGVLPYITVNGIYYVSTEPAQTTQISFPIREGSTVYTGVNSASDDIYSKLLLCINPGSATITPWPLSSGNSTLQNISNATSGCSLGLVAKTTASDSQTAYTPVTFFGSRSTAGIDDTICIYSGGYQTRPQADLTLKRFGCLLTMQFDGGNSTEMERLHNNVYEFVQQSWQFPAGTNRGVPNAILIR